MSNVFTSCRDIEELNNLVRVMLELAITDIKAKGVNPLVVETYRPQERQNYLYCQGRIIAECTAKGISSSFSKAYCNPKVGKVTWTLNSVHMNRKAVDVVPQRIIDGKMTAIWNSQDPQTQIIIKTMQKYGFEAGANWSTTPDSPHFQIKGDFTSVFKQGANTTFVTKAIQTALNSKIKAGLSVDGAWGAKTTAAVNDFRLHMCYKNITSGQLGKDALRDLFAV
jgi:peptidoglycan L-alanyl-D-glutamate endopeptidase CwlK